MGRVEGDRTTSPGRRGQHLVPQGVEQRDVIDGAQESSDRLGTRGEPRGDPRLAGRAAKVAAGMEHAKQGLDGAARCRGLMTPRSAAAREDKSFLAKARGPAGLGLREEALCEVT